MVARTEQLASPRILAGVPGSIEVTLYQEGAATDPGGPFSCVVTSGAGAEVASGAATLVEGEGKLRFDLTAAQNARPALLTATWTFDYGGTEYQTATQHEVLGEFLFTVAQARAYDGGEALASTVKYPASAILHARDRILDAFTDVCGVTFGARYGREVVDGTGTRELDLAVIDLLEVRSIATRAAGGADLEAFSAEDLADTLHYRFGLLYRELRGVFPSGRRNVVVEYEHGLSPVPLEIREAALRLLRNSIVASNLPDRATSQAGEFGAFSLAVAGRPGQWFGIPLVDSVLERYRRRLPGIA